ncbi:hypothetical protein KPL71_023898 [Citrus sinensis]|uniref:Uncharacterized protein n=1 Tax=Citrus sinensis TaxID=2711 RepID=A0ACB8ILY8_CITSI|nr:hypothetical protein KPL71_023898 [Citrus sinensis]
MLDTRFKQYQDAVIGTVLTTLHAGSVLLTFYPNFNLSLQDPNLPTTLKVQVQIQGAEQISSAKIATLHHQLVYRLQNHALDLPTPEHHSDTLMVLAESDQIPTIIQIPRQIPRHELIKLMPLEWISNYEQFHNNTAPIQTSEGMFERRQDGTVRMTFKPPPSAPQEPPRLSFTYSSMITAVQTAQEDLPITGFNSEGYPVYPAKHNGHFLWETPGSGMCDPNCPCWDDWEDDDDYATTRKKKPKKKKPPLAKTCLDKLCEQKQFFKELLKDKEPFWSACKKPYLQIKCKQKKDCDCSPKKKRHFKKFRNPEFSSRPRRSRKPYRFFRKKSSSSRDFKRRKSSRCFICKKKGHFAKDCPNKREKSIRLVEHLQATTDYSPENDELEFYFSEQDEPNDETVFVLQNSSDDSDSDQSQIIFHQQLLSLDTTIPIPSIKLQILPSKFQRPIPAIGLIDTGAQRSMLNPHLLPPEYWTDYEEHFKAVNGKLFTTSLITKKPIGIQIFPNCVI